jgi:cytochrome c556
MLMCAATMAAQQDQRETVTVKQVMETMTIPASDAIFSAAAETQRDAKVWQEARKAAVVLAESGDLLMTGGRAKDSTTWVDMSRALVAQAQAALKAIDAKDGDALVEASDSLYDTCKACHDRYMEK